MAVYTLLTRPQVEALLLNFSLGKLQALHEISNGIENTNYFVDTVSENGGEVSRYVLTVFETISKTDLPFFNDLTTHLADKGFEVPAPVRNREGTTIFEIESKPGMIVQCMSGKSVKKPAIEQCSAMSEYLANMHLALREFSRSRPLARDEHWMDEQAELLEKTKIPEQDLKLLKQSITRYKENYRDQLAECPQGIVHGDLFRDNVLFDGNSVSGVIDFYHACQATLLFDLAVMVNDWAWNESLKTYDEPRLKAIVRAYQSNRPWTEKEHQLWPRCLEVAALRFWVSRLASYYLPGYQQHSVEGDTAKNPDEMKAVLLKAQAL